MNKFPDGGGTPPIPLSRENPLHERGGGGKAPSLLLHSQYICCKYIIEDRKHSEPYSTIFKSY